MEVDSWGCGVCGEIVVAKWVRGSRDEEGVDEPEIGNGEGADEGEIGNGNKSMMGNWEWE